MENLRIALVADVHVGATRSNIQSADSLPLVEQAITSANACNVDLFVTLGDNVMATSAAEDHHHLVRLRDVLKRSKAPVVPLFGNNDLKYLGAARAAAALACEAGSEIRRLNGWTLLFWRPNCDITLDKGPRLTMEDLAWLRDTLREASYPAVLFLHAPIDDHATTGNYYFQQRPDLASYGNGADARALIEESGKVVLVLAGHVHWNAGSTIDGVHYRTLAALVDTFRRGGGASGTWALLDLTPDRLTLDVRGAEPMTWSAPPRGPDEHWLRPLTPGAFGERMQAIWRGEKAPGWDV